MGGRALGAPPLDLPMKTRMPGKWGGARRARPPPRSANAWYDSVVHRSRYIVIFT